MSLQTLTPDLLRSVSSCTFISWYTESVSDFLSHLRLRSPAVFFWWLPIYFRLFPRISSRITDKHRWGHPFFSTAPLFSPEGAVRSLFSLPSHWISGSFSDGSFLPHQLIAWWGTTVGSSSHTPLPPRSVDSRLLSEVGSLFQRSLPDPGL